MLNPKLRHIKNWFYSVTSWNVDVYLLQVFLLYNLISFFYEFWKTLKYKSLFLIFIKLFIRTFSIVNCKTTKRNWINFGPMKLILLKVLNHNSSYNEWINYMSKFVCERVLSIAIWSCLPVQNPNQTDRSKLSYQFDQYSLVFFMDFSNSSNGSFLLLFMDFKESLPYRFPEKKQMFER